MLLVAVAVSNIVNGREGLRYLIFHCIKALFLCVHKLNAIIHFVPNIIAQFICDCKDI